MKKLNTLFTATFVLASVCFGQTGKQPVLAGNPVFPGWYADPEAIIFDDTYWIYPTYSDDYEKPDVSRNLSALQLQTQKNTINPQYLKQTFINAFSSKDLTHWKKHSHVLDIKDIKWAA